MKESSTTNAVTLLTRRVGPMAEVLRLVNPLASAYKRAPEVTFSRVLPQSALRAQGGASPNVALPDRSLCNVKLQTKGEERFQ